MPVFLDDIHDMYLNSLLIAADNLVMLSQIALEDTLYPLDNNVLNILCMDKITQQIDIFVKGCLHQMILSVIMETLVVASH